MYCVSPEEAVLHSTIFKEAVSHSSHEMKVEWIPAQVKRIKMGIQHLL